MNIDIDYIDDENICVCVSGTDYFNVAIERELRREEIPVRFNGLNDEIDYHYGHMTYMRPTSIDRVDGDGDVNIEELRELIEDEINK